MHRIFIAFLLWLCVIFGCKQNSNHNSKRVVKSKGTNQVKIEILSTWIEKVRKFNYEPTDTSLLQEFAGFIKPDTLTNPHWEHVSKDYGKVFNPIFVDLDGDPGEELICLLGWDITCPYLCVFKQIENKWYLIYFEHIDTFYAAPSLSVAGNFSKNKTFYFRHVYQHGSGIYEDGYSFYKLINNKVYHCLDIINDAHVDGWGLFVNQEVKSSFEFSSDQGDEVNVSYNYNFFPGAINTGDCPWCANTDISLIKGEGYVNYVWDAKHSVYKLDIQSYQNGLEDLTAAKIKCFGDFGNDSLFVSAFKSQIDDKLKNGTPQQKKILKTYLNLLKEEKAATTAKLKVTAKIGGTTFYGQDDKK